MSSWARRLVGWSMLLSVSIVAVSSGVAQADEPAPAASGDGDWGADAPDVPGAEKQPNYHPVRGPSRVSLGHELTLDLPDGFFYLGKKDADEMMRRSGNEDDPSLVGVVLKPEASWLVTVSFDAEGYIKDEDGEKLDADEILKAISLPPNLASSPTLANLSAAAPAPPATRAARPYSATLSLFSLKSS